MSNITRPNASADALARAHTAEAIGAVVTVLRDRFARHADKLKAAELILDRGHGKAAQAVIAVPARAALAQRMAAMDDSALLAIAAAARHARGEYPPNEGPDGTPALTGPFGNKPDDVTDAEWQEASPLPASDEPAIEPATSDEFPRAERLDPNPWE